MADYPKMPLWTDRYLADTRHLNRAQHGSYLLLLMEAWRRPRCSLPDDDAMLARLAGCTLEEWKADKPVIMALWKLDGRSKEWVQKGQLKVRFETHDFSNSQRDKSIKRWSKRKTLDAPAHAGDDAGDDAQKCLPDPDPDPVRRREDLATAAAVDPLAAREVSLEPILDAAGIDWQGRDANPKWFGSAQQWVVGRWGEDLGLTEAEQVGILTAWRSTHPSARISTLKFFDGVMQDAAGRKAASPLKPTAGAPNDRPSPFSAFLAGARRDAP